MKTRLAAAFILMLAGGAMEKAHAHMPSDPEAVGNIARLSADANLIFRGKVIGVRYRNSPKGNGSEGIPYTFVTYSVSAVLQGTSPGRRITLRFIGGADGRGGFVEAEGVPRFQVGDEDVLFVAGNGETGCPLVMCEFGRFRVLNGAVHEAHGVPVSAIEGGRVRAEGETASAFDTFRYPAPEFDELLRRPEFVESIRKSGMTLAEARAWYAAEVPETVELRNAEVRRKDAPAASLAAAPAVGVEPFLSAIRSEGVNSRRRVLQPVRSIDPDAPLGPAVTQASAPPPVPAGAEPESSPGKIIRKR